MSTIQGTPAPAAAAVPGKGSAGTTAAQAGGTKSAAGTGISFGGALVQMILGNSTLGTGTTEDTQTAAGSGAGSNLAESLLSLINGGEAAAAETKGTDSPSGQAKALSEALDKLVDLLQSGSDLEDLIAGNPDLMAQLQTWIQQAMQLLQNSSLEQAGTAGLAVADGNALPQIGSGGNALPELPILAKQPETIKFALLDTLQTLKEQLASTSNVGTGTGAPAASFGQLISALQKLLGQNQMAQEPQQQTAVLMNPVSDQTSAVSNSVGQSTAGSGDSFGSQLTKEENASSQKESSSSSDNAPFSGTSVVTAGQLQLRDGAAVTAKAPAPVPVEKFAQEMTSFVVNKLDIVKLQGMSEAKITLTPEHLGQVDIRITLHNGQVVAQFVTEHAFAKDSLEQQMAQLRSALQSQGLQVEKLEVTQNASLSSHMYQDGKQPGSGSQQRQNNRRRTAEEEEGLTSIETLEDWNEWVKEVQAKQENFGSSFVAKA